MNNRHKANKYKERVKRLIDRCLDKDPEAWDELVRLISPLISYIIEGKFRRLRFPYQKDDTENLRQDILLSLWEKDKLKSIKDKESAIPWICAISSHATSNYIRGLKPFDLPKASLLNFPLASYYHLPSEELFKKNMQDDIEAALKSLNHKENLIIKLSLLYKKRYKEISKMLNIPIGTVFVYARRARIKLKRALKKYEKNM